MTKAGPVWTGEVRFNEQWLDQPLHWKRPRRIFVVAHGDLFHENVPDAWIDRIFAVMFDASRHQFQCLTKRAERMHAYMADSETPKRISAVFREHMQQFVKGALLLDTKPEEWEATIDWPVKNVWLGVSVENQETANERIPWLLKTPAAVRWISAEPLLEETVVFNMDGPVDVPWPPSPLDWLVCGGESGPGARPMDPAWARSLRDQCSMVGTAFFMKQMARKATIPTDLLVRQYPTVG